MVEMFLTDAPSANMGLEIKMQKYEYHDYAKTDESRKLLGNDFASTSIAGSRENDDYYATGCVVVDDSYLEIDFDDCKEPDDIISNGNITIKKFYLSDHLVIFFIDEPGYASAEIHSRPTKFADIMAGWYWGDGVSFADFLGEFGLDIMDAIDEADDDYDGKVNVAVEYCYYAGTYNAPHDGLVKDDNGEIITFDSYAAAKEWINQAEDGAYYLSHGEADRPNYKIVKA